MHDMKRMSAYKSGDMIEVRLSDTAYNIHFRRRVNISNLKKMIQLKEDLKHKGIDFDKIETPKEKRSWYD